MERQVSRHLSPAPTGQVLSTQLIHLEADPVDRLLGAELHITALQRPEAAVFSQQCLRQGVLHGLGARAKACKA